MPATKLGRGAICRIEPSLSHPRRPAQAQALRRSRRPTILILKFEKKVVVVVVVGLLIRMYDTADGRRYIARGENETDRQNTYMPHSAHTPH